MTFTFQYDGVKASNRLEEFTRQKLGKLVDRYDFIVRAEVFFKKENTPDPATGKICHIILSVPGPRLFAEASHGEFMQSVAEVINDLESQLRKKKDKMKSH